MAWPDGWCIDSRLAAKQTRRPLHSAFSPDMTPSDFGLFPELKAVLNGSSFEDEVTFLAV
jgi:hypothetical protein